jgi:dTDP-4-dehydrorhamnose reductase
VRSSPPRATALVRQLRGLAHAGTWQHAVLETPGWWRRPERLPAASADDATLDATPILVTGATGTLGQAIARVARSRGLAVRLLSRSEMDIADARSVERALDAERPWAIVNAAGYVRVADAHLEPERCWRENVRGPLVLARAARLRHLPLVTFSSDLVFSGEAERPYVESDTPQPRCPYGSTKAEAERSVLAELPAALVIRTAAFFGPWDAHNFVAKVVRALRTGRSVRAASDQIVSPTYVPDLANAALDLLIDGECGLWHVVNQGSVSWAELALRVALLCGGDTVLVEPTRSGASATTPRRFNGLTSERGLLLPSLESALGRYCAAVEQ